MSEHDAILLDSERLRRARPTYAVHVPAVELGHPRLLGWVREIASALWSRPRATSKPVPSGGAIFYLVIDGRRCRVTLEAL